MSLGEPASPAPSDAEGLARLRARAYGPHADIAQDAAALARLRELEDIARESRRGRSSEHSQDSSESASEASGPQQRPEDPAGAAPVSDQGSPPRPSLIARRWLIAWAGSVLVVAVSVGALVFALASVRPVDPNSGARQVASLDQPVDPSPWVSDAFNAEEDSTFYDFHGLVLAVLPPGLSSPTEECLLVLDARPPRETEVQRGGILDGGCTAGPFSASVQLVVGENSPAQLQAIYPPGSGLRFVLDGDRVGVFFLEGSDPA